MLALALEPFGVNQPLILADGVAALEERFTVCRAAFGD